MKSLLLVVLASTACVGPHGDPLQPSAAGTLRLAPGADATQFQALEIHFDRIDGTYGEDSVSVLQRADSPFVFPMEFGTELGFGTSDASTYRLSVWFSNTDTGSPTTEPPVGSPTATVDVEIGDCTDGCSTIRDVELELTAD